MNLSKEEIDLLNYRIEQEEYSSRIYEQMSLWFEDQGLKNLAKVYKQYSVEELSHAQWAKDFLLSFNLEPKLCKLACPYDEFEFDSIQSILQITLEHEQEVTRQCNELATFALKNNNHVLYSLASKYCSEQIEELEKAYDFISIYKLTNDMLVFDNYIQENYLD